MNHLIFFEQDIGKTLTDCYEIKDSERLNHLLNVIGVKTNQVYKAILINKGLCKAKCTSIELKKVTFQLSEFKLGEARQYDLLIGLSRPQAVKKILEYSSGQPIRKIHFYKAQLSEKSYSTSKIFEEKNISTSLMHGLSQCGRFHTLPEVSINLNHPKDLFEKYGDKYILSLNGTKTILDYPTIKQGPSLIAIGPERGFINTELNDFKSYGFKEILLSSSILRVETAVIALCSQLELLNFQK